MVKMWPPQNGWLKLFMGQILGSTDASPSRRVGHGHAPDTHQKEYLIYFFIFYISDTLGTRLGHVWDTLASFNWKKN